MWGDLVAAVGLMLVLEGVLPFLNPAALRRAAAAMSALGDRQLRLAGLVSMLAGLLLVYLARH